ncbi:EF-hand domain-containing protein [Sphingomonas sp. CBMAI 2297]|uniref:EF-hand domain-containing protein n=1 Tax=Sphingomonas sp. CBMAI 2297 TaxID=2991720 RepID=UPI002455D8D1|nr:EF-hand domain-containing protein [Sphingomonas sp. CBMAI 2297]MDH4745091.1 EF-hand domain-containing protein [Sphingomonas sp. CBMAI 2297]
MWRYLVGAAGALLLVVAGLFLFRGSASTETRLPPAPAATVASETEQDLPAEPPSAAAKTREQKRFDRIDKDKNDTITKDEYFALRRKLFAKLDTDRDGKLSFEEWSVKAVERFQGADKDKSGTLTRAEFATTAVKRNAKPRCACAPAKTQAQAPGSPRQEAGDSED